MRPDEKTGLPGLFDARPIKMKYLEDITSNIEITVRKNEKVARI